MSKQPSDNLMTSQITRFRIHVVLVAILITLLTGTTADAWWSGGHRVIANIAYDRLSPEVRAEIVALLKKTPRFAQEFEKRMPKDLAEKDKDRWIFLQASIWPDLVRWVEPHDRPTWHYVNQPIFLTELDEKALKSELKTNVRRELPKDLPNVAVPTTPLNVIQAIKLCRLKLIDPKLDDRTRATYYCWLLHLIGDLHQPMHSAGLFSRARFNDLSGDKGGNAIPVKLTKTRNLHALWDSLLGDDISLNDVRGRAAKLVSDPKLREVGEKASKDLKVNTWSEESHELAKSFTYDPLVLREVMKKESTPKEKLEPVVLPKGYLKGAGEHAQRRGVQAGYRLAAVLEEIAKVRKQ